MILSCVFTQSGLTHDDFFYLETTYTCQFMLKALTEIWRKEQFLRSPLGGGKIVKKCYLTVSKHLPSFPFSQVTQSTAVML